MLVNSPTVAYLSKRATEEIAGTRAAIDLVGALELACDMICSQCFYCYKDADHT